MNDDDFEQGFREWVRRRGEPTPDAVARLSAITDKLDSPSRGGRRFRSLFIPVATALTVAAAAGLVVAVVPRTGVPDASPAVPRTQAPAVAMPTASQQPSIESPDPLVRPGSSALPTVPGDLDALVGVLGSTRYITHSNSVYYSGTLGSPAHELPVSAEDASATLEWGHVLKVQTVGEQTVLSRGDPVTGLFTEIHRLGFDPAVEARTLDRTGTKLYLATVGHGVQGGVIAKDTATGAVTNLLVDAPADTDEKEVAYAFHWTPSGDMLVVQRCAATGGCSLHAVDPVTQSIRKMSMTFGVRAVTSDYGIGSDPANPDVWTTYDLTTGAKRAVLPDIVLSGKSHAIGSDRFVASGWGADDIYRIAVVDAKTGVGRVLYQEYAEEPRVLWPFLVSPEFALISQHAFQAKLAEGGGSFDLLSLIDGTRIPSAVLIITANQLADATDANYCNPPEPLTPPIICTAATP